ncbi:MAG TPA: DUF4190 domain-containing protein [Blastocatellia bacterium]
MRHDHLCNSCGVKIEVGRAICPVCGARAGTVFSQSVPIPPASKTGNRSKTNDSLSVQDGIEKARERANHSLILSLLGLFPILGFFLAPFSIYMALGAVRTLKSYHVEDGRGVATAGIVIGALAVIAQISYCLLAVGSKQSPTSLFGL